MTNSETIEKLNEALNQLIDAYEILQDKNTSLENEIKQKNDNINDLESKLNDANGHTEVQSNKMDGMLNRIQSLLTVSNSNYKNESLNENLNENDSDDEIDLTINEEDTKENNNNNDLLKNNNKIDLGRMESLLNGLNTK